MNFSATAKKLLPFTEAKTSSSIINRQADFWLLGGASIFLFLFVVLTKFLSLRTGKMTEHLQSFTAMFATLQLVVNFPHFIISYKFGYGRGKKFIFEHWVSLIAVPIAIIIAMVVAWVGLNLTPNVNGAAIVTWSLFFMTLSVHWHYAKQVFGCIMVYARYDNYPIDQRQRKLILGNLYLIAAVNYIFGMNKINDGDMFLFPKAHFPTPSWVYTGALVLCALSVVPVIYFVFYKNFKERKLLPSQNFLVSWLALFIWFIPFFNSVEYYLVSVPFFHSLQYLPFAYRLEKVNKKPSRWGNFAGILNISLILIIGLVAFETLPEFLDKSFPPHRGFQVQYFLAAFTIFLNVHHYFIDSVVWKFKDAEVRNSLFGA